MLVKVGASKRNGVATTIFDQQIDISDIVPSSDGGVKISFVAQGVYDRRSRYRYSIVLSRDELVLLTAHRQ
jgi:hypothetical protein